MARPRPTEFDKKKIVAENRKARFEYFIEDVYEAGIALQGTEVKALRFGEGSIAESYAEIRGEQAWLVNANIPEFSHGNRFNHEPKRPRKLLMHRRELERLQTAMDEQRAKARAAWAGSCGATVWASPSCTRTATKCRPSKAGSKSARAP